MILLNKVVVHALFHNQASMFVIYKEIHKYEYLNNIKQCLAGNAVSKGAI